MNEEERKQAEFDMAIGCFWWMVALVVVVVIAMLIA